MMAVSSNRDMKSVPAGGEPDFHQKSPMKSLYSHDLERDDELQLLRLQIGRLQEENQSEIDSNNDLQKRVLKLENEKLQLMANRNEEVSELDSQVVQLREQLEQSEAARQQAEFEIITVKRGNSQDKHSAAEREGSLNTIIEAHKDKISELTSKVKDLQSSLVSQRRFTDETEAKHRVLLEEKQKELQTVRAEIDIIRNEKEQLERVFHEQESIYAETQEKVHELKTERDTQTNSVRQQLRELQYAAKREDRLKKELEVAIGRIKTLEETIEAERAAHLESKFNSELVQLQVRDLKGALEVEKSAHSEIERSADVVTKKLGELETGFEEERSAASNARQQLESLNRENELLKQQLNSETESKRTMVANMDAQLDIHQINFEEIKQELSKAKKRQIYLEETYGGSMRELELLLHNFQINGDKTALIKQGKTKKAGSKNGEELSPMLVLETLRHTLKDYQNRLELTAQELIKMKSRSEKMEAECEKYKEVTWSRSQIVQDLQKKVSSSSKELEEVRHQLGKRESQVTTLKLELHKATHHAEMEGGKAADVVEELRRQLKELQDEEEKHRIYLHSLYQRIMAGRLVLDPREPVLSSFTWEELSIAVQDQIVGLMTGLNRTNEKVTHLETVIHNKDELLREVQHSHEESLERLEGKTKERETEWQKQRVELEEQFSQQLADLHIKSQKTQTLADQAWEKARLTGTVKQGLESECCLLREQLGQAIWERSGLLVGCCLLAGSLLPMFSRLNQLASQRRALEEQVRALEVVRQQAQQLASTLSMEETDLEKHSQDTKQPLRNPVLMFRRAVIAVMAANRLNHLGRRSCCIFTAVDNPSGVHSVPVCAGIAKPSQEPFIGLGDVSSPNRQTYRNRIDTGILDWFTSPTLLNAVVESCSELQETINNKDPSSPQALSSTARSCFVKLVSKLAQIFEPSPLHAGRSGYGSRDKGMLVRLLGYGLSQGMTRSSLGGQSKLVSSQEIMKCLQRNIINFTQRLHTAEVERRSLRMETNKLRQENSELWKEGHRVTEMEKEITQLRDLRQHMVMREKFENVCQELSKALSREQQAQELLNEQSRQLEELGMRLNLYTTEELEKDATITEAVKGLSEAKMELRRKDQSIRQLSKQLSQLEEDKKSLKDSVQDVQGVLQSSNKDKDKLAGYLQSIQAAVEETKRQLISRADNRTIDSALRQVLIHPEHRGINNITAEVVAIKGLVAAFVDAVQTSVSRLSALETEIASHKQHIATLKDELKAACRRAYPVEEPDQGPDDVIRPEVLRIPERSFERSRPLYETDRSYMEQFVPLKGEPDFSVTLDASRFNTSPYTSEKTPLETSTQRKGKLYSRH